MDQTYGERLRSYISTGGIRRSLSHQQDGAATAATEKAEAPNVTARTNLYCMKLDQSDPNRDCKVLMVAVA